MEVIPDDSQVLHHHPRGVRIFRANRARSGAIRKCGAYVRTGFASGQRRPGANARITICVIGNGRRGTQNMEGLLHCPEAQIVAHSEWRKPRLDAAKAKVEEYYGTQTASGKYKGCAVYPDFRELIARGDIDVVVVAPPGHWHGIVATLPWPRERTCTSRSLSG